MVQPIRQFNAFPEKLRYGVDGSDEFGRSGAQARQRLLHAWPELSGGALELCNLCVQPIRLRVLPVKVRSWELTGAQVAIADVVSG